MSTQIAAEMYTVRDAADADLAATLERIAEIGYLGVELVGLHGATPAEFRAHLDRLELELIGMVLPFPDEAEFEEYHGFAVELGCASGIIMLEDRDFATPEAVARTAERCNDFAARVRPDGIELLYHNHWWETMPREDGTVPLVEFAALLEPGVGLVADIYWVAAGGIDVAATLTELGSKVRRVHVKDGYLKQPVDPTEPMTAVGDGKVDIAAALAAAPQADWHVAELDEYDGDPLEALEKSYRYLVAAGLSHGRKPA
ncbi:MAG TPA: sugar phosphate isomerase/epimerase [Solirubrobacterales bacterium]|nr:sugar phosphate isomerase/epimerase [Solirubrobacterales bacterium]